MPVFKKYPPRGSVRVLGGATAGVGYNVSVGGGQCPPTFWTRGYRGTGGGTMKMIFASTAFSTVEVTEFQLP